MNMHERMLQGRGWNDEERAILEQVQRMSDEVIAPNAERVDATGEFPWENVEAINALGLNAVFVPEEYGGMPMSYRLYLEIVAILSEACASTGIIYATNYHGMKPLIEYGSAEQKARLLPAIAEGGLGALAITEPTAGSDATGMKTSFTPEGEEIVVKGSKIFITNGDVADRILLFGKWAGIAEPKKAISVLVLEKGAEGFSVISKEKKMGHHGSSTCALSFDTVRVPRANLVGEPGEGLKILLGSLNRSRPSVAAHALGIARAAFRDMVAYGSDRVQGGRRVLDFQGNQFMLADLASELVLVESWLDHVAGLVDGGAEEFGMEASVAKMRASDLAMRMATECVQVHGGYGYCRDYRAERLMRDAKITQIWEGTNQVHRQLIGRSFIRK
ncbi:acyl-CoA dehydrogenase family protein [Celeribacter indicus]|uniref:3-sulfinopropanoyl-CoA desulfinase n=1 Tax=Celeribacter indicus TaxID=1208324 RepID=A0A0B5E0N0_9RHOB|nr:acyl-CoA dehydrogenase family protein [Celeribacter indicus]AJE49165.1 acyl-CoA dehydrogenase [Celeribacter indicus]AJE49193.1 acyl-CoA dehydrogenase [Celeribacter indicus]SDX17938.1 butyryl-CoA dehydrogenase [Celeribacter indicus]SDX18516.1 Acyl-CoA dehydrogenase [Celeribacter indicus]